MTRESVTASTPGQASEPLVRWPFSTNDEMLCYFDVAAEPVNVHLEVRVPGRLDKAAFRTAAATAIMANPRAASRRAPGSAVRRRYLWELPARLDTDPVSFTTFTDDAELARQRATFIGRSPCIDQSPPVRLLVASGPDADYVILNAHHAALDGHSCLELLRAIGRRYRGVPTDGTEQEGSLRGPGQRLAPLRETGQAGRAPSGGPAGAEPGGISLSAAKPGLSRLRRAWRPARIAAQRGTERGYGLHLMLLPDVPVVRNFATGDRATLNEALITSFIATVWRWNTWHGRPARLVRVTVPVNARKKGELAPAGNYSRLVTIAALAPQQGDDLMPLLSDVARQARRARQEPGPQLGASFRGLAAIWCPAVVKHWLVRAALRTVGPLVCDTVMLTNLGRVTDPPDFGVGGSTMAFSAQAQMPRGLCIGVITAGDRLQVAFRYNRALLDQTAAESFAELFTAALGEITHTTGTDERTEQPWRH
jgi:NRPS condensation-like uncharacterized protein